MARGLVTIPSTRFERWGAKSRSSLFELSAALRGRPADIGPAFWDTIPRWISAS